MLDGGRDGQFGPVLVRISDLSGCNLDADLFISAIEADRRIICLTLGSKADADKEIPVNSIA